MINFHVKKISVIKRQLLGLIAGSDPLMREIYEVDDPTPPRSATDIHPGHPAFWKYRIRLTVEHIIRQFQDVRSNKDSCKILGKFLEEVLYKWNYRKLFGKR